jgi:hypothetical protein
MFLTTAVNLNTVTLTCKGDVITESKDAEGKAFGTIDTTGTVLTGSFTNGQIITLKSAAATYSVEVMQSTLPSLFIDLADTESLDKIHANKDYKAEGSTVNLTDKDNASYNIVNAKNAELKGRGNSSWDLYDKKGYQLKFDKKQDVLGLGAAKKWVLLANTCDASMMMNKLAFDLSKNIGLQYSTEGEYADLWIDGDYRGTYLVTDKIEIGSTRVNIGDDDVISELDNGFYEGETYFEDLFGSHFTLKDPDVSNAGAMDNFKHFEALIDELEEYLPNSDWSQVTSRLNIESMAKVYLINEYFLNNEYTVSSSYWYTDSIIYAGPVWDFDSAAYKQGSATSYYVEGGLIVNQLLHRKEFRSIVEQTYQNYINQFVQITAEIDALESKLSTSAAMNYTRWDQLGKPDKKSGVFEATYDANVQLLKSWMIQRQKAFTISDNGGSVYMDIADDRNTVTLTYTNDNGGGNIKFAFWNDHNDQDDLVWCDADYVGNNTWTTTVYLSEHEYSGIFYLHVYDSGTLMVGGGYAVRKTNSTIGTQDMYRLYNPNSGEHFYTANTAEKDHLVSVGWIYECIGWTAPQHSNTPVYRLYNANGGEHHYTVDASEKDMLVAAGWNYEGIGWYSDDNKQVPLYRQYNPNAYSCNHNYTADVSERDHLISLGWHDEGIGWYGM